MPKKLLEIIVHPNCKKPRILERDEALHIYISEKPVKGQANQAVIKVLAKHLQVAKSKLKVVRGEFSRKKLVEVDYLFAN